MQRNTDNLIWSPEGNVGALLEIDRHDQRDTRRFDLTIRSLGSMIHVNRIYFGTFFSQNLESLPYWDFDKDMPCKLSSTITISKSSSIYPNFIIEGHDGRVMLEPAQLIFKRPIINTSNHPIYDARLARSNWAQDEWKINPIKFFLNTLGFDTSTLGIEVQARIPQGTNLLESEKEWASKGDCFIAILTSRYQLDDTSSIHSAWVHTESGLSYSRDRPQLVFVEDGVKLEGLYRYVDDNHIIKFDPKNPMALNSSVQKVMQFRKECEGKRLVNTVLNIGTIALVGSALYGIANFLENLGKSTN